MWRSPPMAEALHVPSPCIGTTALARARSEKAHGPLAGDDRVGCWPEKATNAVACEKSDNLSKLMATARMEWLHGSKGLRQSRGSRAAPMFRA